MAMNSLKAISMLKKLNFGDEEHENPNSYEETLGSKGENKPKNVVHRFYLVKFRPYNEASKILEAERLIEKLYQKYDELLKQDSLKSSIHHQYRRKLSILSGLKGQKKRLDDLKLVLDELDLAGKIPHKHKGGPHYTQGIKSCISHGSSNLVVERKLLKEMARSQHRLNDLDLSSRSREMKRFMGSELREIEEKKAKAFADYAEKPHTFDPLYIKNAIEEQIQIVKKMSAELKIEEREIGPAIDRLKKQLIPTTKEPVEELNFIKNESLRFSYDERRENFKQRRKAQRCISKLKQTSVEMNGMYDEYVSLLSNVGELARNKDIAALRKLSHHQIEEFMSKWNHPNLKTFRVNYEDTILDSLRNRRLSQDGRIEFYNDDEETLRYIEDGFSE